MKVVSLIKTNYFSLYNFIFTVLIIGVTIFSIFTRFTALDKFPAGLNQDEAVHGYDAYAISQTGKDHYGQTFPIIFRAFDDWVEPVFTYILVPCVMVFGLSAHSIRIPGAIAGSIGVLIWFFLLRRLGLPKKWQLFGTILLATASWHNLLSRWAIPQSLAINFSIVLLFTLSFLSKSSTKKFTTQILILLGVFLTGTLLTYTYPTYRVFIPSIFFTIFITQTYLKKRIDLKLFTLNVCYGITVAPLWILSATQPEINSRFFENSTLHHKDGLLLFIQRYFEYFSPQFLFGSGDVQITHQVPGISLLPALLVIPFVLGVYDVGRGVIRYLVYREEKDDYFFKCILATWVVLAPIPAALTDDPMHVLRVAHLLPALLLIVIYGGKYLEEQLAKRNVELSKYVIVVLSITAVIQYLIFIHSYFGQYQRWVGLTFNQGLQQSIEKTFEISCKEVMVDNTIIQPYIYYLFFMKVHPSDELYQQTKQKTTISYGVTVSAVDNFTFRNIQPSDISNVEIIPNNYYENRFRIYRAGDNCFIVQ